jgi:hypothetical protein
MYKVLGSILYYVRKKIPPWKFVELLKELSIGGL